MLSVPATINQAIGAVSGFTTPTFTTSASSTTFPNGKGYVVTAKGGTQPAPVDVHSASRPFSMLVTRPQNLRTLPAVNSAGVLPDVPKNRYQIATKKGVTVLAGQPSSEALIRTELVVPAGSDLADPSNLAAMCIAHIQLLAQIVQGVVDTSATGEI